MEKYLDKFWIEQFGDLNPHKIFPGNTRAVYGLLNEAGELFYIGQAENLLKRLAYHTDTRPFAKFICLPVPDNVNITNWEVSLIAFYTPTGNRQLPVNDLYIGFDSICTRHFNRKQKKANEFLEQFNLEPEFFLHRLPYFNKEIFLSKLKPFQAAQIEIID